MQLDVGIWKPATFLKKDFQKLMDCACNIDSHFEKTYKNEGINAAMKYLREISY
jgi:hypothetical protein